MACALILSVAAATPAAAEDQSRPCTLQEDETACYVDHQERFLGAFGLPRAEAHRDAGDALRRVLIFGRNIYPEVAIEFVRSPGSEPMVSIYRPLLGSPAVPASPAYSAAVPLADWHRINRESRYFDRSLVPLPEERATRDIYPCADGGFDIVETADPGASAAAHRVRRKAEGTCRGGLAVAFAEELVETAVRLLPACGALEEPLPPTTRLAQCALLEGDRLAAARAYSLLQRLNRREDSTLGYLFDQDATIVVDGAIVPRDTAAAKAWLRHTPGALSAKFQAHRVIGESVVRVRVEGALYRWTVEAKQSVLWKAPVSLVMVGTPHTSFSVIEARIGSFAPARQFCALGRWEVYCYGNPVDPDGREK